MKKRVFAFLLAVCLAAGTFAACGEQPSEVTSTGENASDTSAGAAAGQQPLLPYQGDPVTLRMLGWESFSSVNPDTKFGKWMQEQLGNVTIEYEIPAEGTDTKISMYLASGDMPDIMMHRNPDSFMTEYGDGSRTVTLLDYAQYMPEYTQRREEYPHLSRYDKDGACYMFLPCWYDLPSEVWSQNQTIMDKYNLKAPTNYQEMKAVMDAVLPNEPGMFGMLFNIWGFGYQFQCFSHLFGSVTGPTSIYYDYNKSKWVYAITGDEEIFKEAATEMAEGYQKGYIHADFASMTEETLLNTRNNGTALFYNLYLDAVADQSFETSVLSYKPAFIDPPAAEGVTPFIRADYTSDCTGWGFVVGKNSEHPELACSVLELIGSKNMAEVNGWGWEGDTFEIKDGKKQFTESFLALSNDEIKTTYGITGAEPYTFQPHMSKYYTSDAMTSRWSDEAKRGGKLFAEKLTSGEYKTYYGRVEPKLDELAKQDIATIKTAVDTYVTETLIAFVLGNKPLSEWDSFIAAIPSYGDMDWVLQQYNDAPQNADRPDQTQRTYVNP